MEKKYGEERIVLYVERMRENKLRGNALTAFFNSLDGLGIQLALSTKKEMRDIARYIEDEFCIQEVELRIHTCRSSSVDACVQEMPYFNKKALQFLQKLSDISV